ncbi:hypothetical protein GCM10022227_46580 [Streptomyces sedi]
MEAPQGKGLKFVDRLLENASELGTTLRRNVGDACNSFVAGTHVLMADGTTRPIEELRIGDKVLATDPETGETSPRTVTAEITSTGTKHLTALTLATEEGPTTLTATDADPFWNQTTRAWTDAAELTVGTELTAPDGTTTTVTTLTRHTRASTVHNLTVEGLHTYYVLAGQTPVLVHNSNCPLTGGFKVGVSPDEIADINRGFGGETLLNGSPASTLANASRYDSFWDKSAVVIRDIAGSHMFNNGNKRTAQATVEQLMERNGVTSGPTSADLRSVIDRVSKGQLRDVSDISAALRGY